MKPLWKTTNPYAPPKEKSAGGEANAAGGKEQSCSETPQAAAGTQAGLHVAPGAATIHAAARAEASHARLRVSPLPESTCTCKCQSAAQAFGQPSVELRPIWAGEMGQ